MTLFTVRVASSNDLRIPSISGEPPSEQNRASEEEIVSLANVGEDLFNFICGRKRFRKRQVNAKSVSVPQVRTPSACPGSKPKKRNSTIQGLNVTTKTP